MRNNLSCIQRDLDRLLFEHPLPDILMSEQNGSGGIIKVWLERHEIPSLFAGHGKMGFFPQAQLQNQKV